MPSGRSKNVSLTEAQKSLFVAGTQFVTPENGRTRKAFLGMTIGTKRNAAGKVIGTFRDPRAVAVPNWYKGTRIRDIKGKSGAFIERRTRDPWKATTFKAQSQIRLKDLKEMALQLAIASHLCVVNMEHWKYVLVLRAQKIFQESFELKRFNSDGTAKWRANTRNTYLKRVRKYTWPGAGKLMQEYGDLQKSIIVKEKGANGNPVVTTAPIHGGKIFAGVHNNPSPGMTYGNIFGRKPVTQRQFMGHSTKIDEFMLRYQQRYLFDMVFRVPKAAKPISTVK